MADAFENILGQPQVREFLRATVASGRVSHAYLFCGPAGSNKTLAALAFAQGILCPKGPKGPRGGNCGACDACGRIMRKKHPDVRMFESMLVQMNLTPAEVIFIGNDMYRDVFGANRLGIKTVFFKSNQGEQRKSGAEPDYIIYDFRQLPEAVRFLEARA